VLAFGRRRDADGFLRAEGVLHEAAGKRIFQSAELGFVEAWHDDFNLKFTEVQRTRGVLCAHANPQAFGRESACGEVLGDMLADAAAEGSEQKLRRRHALVGGSVFGGLIKHNTVITRLRGEGCATGVLQGDFQVCSWSQAFPWVHLWLSTRWAIPWNGWNRAGMADDAEVRAECCAAGHGWDADCVK